MWMVGCSAVCASYYGHRLNESAKLTVGIEIKGEDMTRTKFKRSKARNATSVFFFFGIPLST